MIFKNAKIIGDGIDPDAYHRQEAKRGDMDFVMSRGELHEFLNCPHRWRMGYKEIVDEDKGKSIIWGSLLDSILLDPDRFDEKYVTQPEMYVNEKNEEKKWSNNATVCKAWNEENKDKNIIKAEKLVEANTAVEAIKNDPIISAVLQNSMKQVMIIGEYHDEKTGIIVRVKILLDILPLEEAFLVDFKTAKSAQLWPFKKQILQLGYHFQAAFYMDVYNSACDPDDKREEFRFIIQENFAPYETGRRILADEYLTMGRGDYENALRMYCQCLATGEWPGYDDIEGDAIDGWTFVDAESWMVT